MKESILFVGLDVDDKAFHGTVFSLSEGVIGSFSCKPECSKLIKQLEKFNIDTTIYRICYESTYLGFSLARDLIRRNYQCDVIASSMIPGCAGDHVKTDKKDSKKLAEYYAKDLLTKVHLPTEDDEADRSLVRSRQFLVEKIKDLKLHILSLYRTNNINYKQESGKLRHWTDHHVSWLNQKITSNEIPESLLETFKTLLTIYNQLNGNLNHFNKKIEELSVTEIGDVNRFTYAKQLMSYAGLGVREYSSGGKERKYGITKMGNKFIRTAVIESCQQPLKMNYVSRYLVRRRESAEPQLIAIADRCQKRLYKKAYRLQQREKNKNKIKVACGREMLGFIWEALKLAS